MKQARQVENQAQPGYEGAPELNVSGKQFGHKIGKHASDYGFEPGDASARTWMRQHVDEIGRNPDEVRQGEWRGGCHDYLFYRKGSDVVVAKPDGTFVTILKDGEANSWFKGAGLLG